MPLPDHAATVPGYATGGVAASTPSTSAVSWGAIFAGAAGAAALSLILLILGVGLGLSSVSPWAAGGIGAGAFGVSTVLWLTFTQLAASGMGGYLAGRLRARWAATQADEVYFRDTAHGFLAWAVASLATAAMLGSAIGSIVGGTAQAGASVIGGAATTTAAATGGAAMSAARSGDSAGSGTSPVGYYVDLLFRRNGTGAGSAATAAATAAAPASDAASGATATSSPATAPTPTTASADTSAPIPTAEVGRIIANAVASGNLSPDDTRYLGQMVAQRTGLAPAEAERRVTDTFNRLQTSLQTAETQVRDAADKARKASAAGALWLFVSMLIGAFVASWAATLGGRQRDL